MDYAFEKLINNFLQWFNFFGYATMTGTLFLCETTAHFSPTCWRARIKIFLDKNAGLYAGNPKFSELCDFASRKELNWVAQKAAFAQNKQRCQYIIYFIR